MLYRFKSRATADLILLLPHARRLLEIIGKEPGAKASLPLHRFRLPWRHWRRP